MPKKEYWLFTRYEDLPCWVLEFFDVIKIGEYKQDLKVDGFPASSNQKILKRGRDY